MIRNPFSSSLCLNVHIHPFALQRAKIDVSATAAVEANRISSIVRSLGAERLGGLAGSMPAIDAVARRVIAAGDAPEHFYVFDLGAVLERWSVWTAALPRVQPHYAVKCNPDRKMLSLLAALGAGSAPAPSRMPFTAPLACAFGKTTGQ